MRIPHSTAIMSMLAALCMVTPASPDPEQSSALAEAPEVQKKKVAALPTAQNKRCLLTAFGDKPWERESSPDDESAAAVVMPGMSLAADDDMEADVGGKSAGQDKGKPPAVERPRLWKRPKKQASVVEVPEGRKLERSASFAEAPEERKLDLDMEFELSPVSSCVVAGAGEVETALERLHAADVERLSSPGPVSPSRMPAAANVQCTPPRTVVKLDNEYSLSPLKQLRLFDRFELLDDADEL